MGADFAPEGTDEEEVDSPHSSFAPDEEEEEEEDEYIQDDDESFSPGPRDILRFPALGAGKEQYKEKDQDKTV